MAESDLVMLETKKVSSGKQFENANKLLKRGFYTEGLLYSDK